MPELLLELFGEEIPARMQAGGAAELARLVGDALSPLAPTDVTTFAGPRRLALAASLNPAVPAAASTERGPRAGAPEQALAGFLRKHGAARAALREEGGYWVLERRVPEEPAAALIARAVPALLRRFAWPKSMRWGGTSGFTWVRPLRRILCLLDGAVVPFTLAEGADDGHALTAGALTEGHRFHAPGPHPVTSLADWRETLASNRVVVAADDRRRLIEDGLARLAAEHDLTVVPDPGLVDEVAGLVEWPVPLLGRIDAEFMNLPPEVMQVSLRVNQRYVVTRDAAGAAAPWFGFAANIEALDGGTAIIAGNERVLRARLSDARHFWDLDRRTRLEDRIPALASVTFHAKLGSQAQRAERMGALAQTIAPKIGVEIGEAVRATRLCKADLTTGMVGEFPELQGVMGGYYARHDGELAAVADAVRDHYAPRGATDPVPTAPVSMVVALADKIDQVTAFFAVDEKPTGSGDPYALRRAALGIIRIVRERRPGLDLAAAVQTAIERLSDQGITSAQTLKQDVLAFIAERLRIQLRAEGLRHDMVAAVLPRALAAAGLDIERDADRALAIAAFLASPDGADLTTAYRRAANILAAEEKRDAHPAEPGADPDLLAATAEQALADALDGLPAQIADDFAAARFTEAMHTLARLRVPLDAFFTDVTVNDPDPALRANRLRLLASVRAVMNQVADFSALEG